MRPIALAMLATLLGAGRAEAGSGDDAAALHRVFERLRRSVVGVESVVGEWTRRGVPIEKEHRAVGVVVAPRRVLAAAEAAPDVAGTARVSLFVRPAAGDRLPARLLARSPENGLLLLAVDDAAFELPPVEFARDDSLEVGDVVATLRLTGPNFGHVPYLDAFLVSGRVERPRRFYLTTFAVSDDLGGPVATLDGRVVGIVARVAVRGRAPSARRSLFAAPFGWSDDGREVVLLPAGEFSGFLSDPHPEVEGAGEVRGWLGVRVQPLVRELLLPLGLEAEDGGVLLTRVLPESPAAEVGLRPGDAVLAVDGEPLPLDERSAPVRFAEALARRRPGETVRLLLARDGRRFEAVALLADPPPDPATVPVRESERLGAAMRDLLPGDRADLALGPEETGVLLVFVRPSGPLGQAGLRAGDLVEAADGTPVRSAVELADRLEGAAADGGSAVLFARRGRETFFARVEFPPLRR